MKRILAGSISVYPPYPRSSAAHCFRPQKSEGRMRQLWLVSLGFAFLLAGCSKPPSPKAKEENSETQPAKSATDEKPKVVKATKPKPPPPEKTAQEWIQALAEKDPGVRIKAAEALGKMGGKAKEAIPALLSLLRDDR